MTAFTALLGLALPVTGELDGTWGDTVNNSITSLVDSAIAGTTTISTDADVTLTSTTLAANQSRQAILLCTGARTDIRTITAPAQSKIYTVINNTTGDYPVKIVGVGPTTGITIPAGKAAILAWDGSDFVDASSYIAGGANIQGLTVGRGGGALDNNTAVGASALNVNSSGDYNTAVGVGVMQLSESAANNTAVGANALVHLVTGNQNVAVGNSALLNLDGYNSNVAVGASAMGAAQCSQSVGVGFGTLFSNTADGLVAVGTEALTSNTTGPANTAVGYAALLNNTTGNANTAVGYQASQGTGSANTSVGCQALNAASGSANTAIGAGAGSGITTGGYNVVIGTYSGSAAPISSTGNAWVVLSNGNGDIYQAMDITSVQFPMGALVQYAPAPTTTISAVTTLTNAQLLPQIVVTSGTSFTLTMPTGSTLEGLIVWAGDNLGFDFSVINTASGTITMAVNTGVTAVGTLTVLTGISARFRLRRTTTNTFIMYRV